MNGLINKIHCCDCLEFMKSMPGHSVDLILTDPPYNIGDSNKLCKRDNKIVTNKEMWGHFEPTNTKEWLEYLNQVFVECYRICKGSIVCYYNRFEVSIIKNMLEKIGYYPKNLLGFIKENPLPHFRKSGFRSNFELAVYCQKKNGKDTFNFLDQKSMICLDKVVIGRNDTEHPTEKPLKVFKKYVKIMSNETDIIFDPFMGSGTTAVAAYQLGRRFIGCEINREYCDIADRRLAEAKNNLFEG